MEPISNRVGDISERRRRALRAATAALALAPLRRGSASTPPVRIGLDLEISDPTSTSDEAITAGARVAVREINAAGGVLGGRLLELVVGDNRGLPAHGIDNARAFAAIPDLVAYLCGKFSAIALAQLPVLHREELILLDPWAAADAIIDHDYRPSYTFRLSLRDGWAASALLAEARRREFRRLVLLVPRNAWGRSFEEALATAEAMQRTSIVVEVLRYNWAVVDDDFSWQASHISRVAPDALLMVANEPEGARIIVQMQARAALRKLPILSHWGILGGPIHRMVPMRLDRVDLSVVGTVDPVRAAAQTKRTFEAGAELLGASSAERIVSVPGFAHAYDLVRLLACAVELAGTTRRSRVRDALEHLPPWYGTVRQYRRAFTPACHEALEPEDVRIFRFDAEGALRVNGPSA